MTNEYPGLPAVARHLWVNLTAWLIGSTMPLVLVASFVAVLLIALDVPAIGYLVVAAGAFAVHSAAFMYKDVRDGDFDPSQTEFVSLIQGLIVLSIYSVAVSTLLIIGSVGAWALESYTGLPAMAVWGFAAYYPVADLAVARSGYVTPSGFVALALWKVSGSILDSPISPPDPIPLFGKQGGRPH